MEQQPYGIDLHIHTTSSDGTRTVEETMQDAWQFGLHYIAITDHNQFSIKAPMTYKDMQIIPGAEFSTSYKAQNGRLLEVHVVGLFFEGVPENIWNIFDEIPIQRKRYVDAILDKLKAIGIDIFYDELLEEFPDSNQIGRRHIAELLVKKAYAKTITDAFDRLIGNRSPYWVDSSKYMVYMPLEDCLKVIIENGGIPILAHPYHYHLCDTDVVTLIKDYKNLVGDAPAGIEVYYSKYGEERRGELLKNAKKFQLYPSAASDRHGEKDIFERGDESLLSVMMQACQARKSTR